MGASADVVECLRYRAYVVIDKPNMNYGPPDSW